MSVAKKTVLITGCSPGGIGHALALEFHKQGCHVIATARKPEALKALQDMGMSAVSLELTDAQSIAACKEEVAKITGGKLDILVNNAGLTHTIPALDIDLDDVRKTYEANVFGPMAMCQSFSSLLIPARGLILQIGSISAVMPYAFASVYASTKGALSSYSRVLRMELKPFNVRVMVAMTGAVRSNLMNHFDRVLPEKSLYKPIEDVFVQRLRFSQTQSTMDTHEYARKIVRQALKGEGWFWGWVGRTPDWYWIGGLSYGAWLLDTMFPTWLSDSVVGWVLRLGVWSKRLRAAHAKKD